MWVRRYRIRGSEQTPLVIGLVADFPPKDEASLEADRLGSTVPILKLAVRSPASLRSITSESSQISWPGSETV
jgi:hypothetical protein